MLLEFASFLWLRRKLPTLKRPFRVPLELPGLVVLCLVPSGFLVYVMVVATKTVYLGFLDPDFLEMNEMALLSITEKRTTHKPGGCVGIFFQLFDWNRRLAKKKLFSRKLLPPARPKQVSKKFGGDENMPKTKLHLISDENSGSYPNVKRNGKGSSSCLDLEPKHEMRVPSLVARLIGLESIPTVQKDKQKKALFTGSCDVREEGYVNEHDGSNSEDLSSEKGNGKIESRPQKLQKTGQFERWAVTRFGAEALQIKGVFCPGHESINTQDLLLL